MALSVCGWLARSELTDPRLKVETSSRFHVVSRVTAPDGRMAVVKYPADGVTAGGRSLSRELFIYRLAQWVPAIASILPSPIVLDETRQFLAVEYVGLSGSQWPLQFVPHPITDASVVLRLGSAMAKWHVDTTEISLLPSLSTGVLHLGEDIDMATADRSAGVSRFMRFIASDPALGRLLADASSLYRELCLIHGDIRGDNWVLQENNLKLIDWEMSGVGDPAWDVASAFAEMVLQAIRESVGAEPGASGWPRANEKLIPIFLAAYHAIDNGMEITERLVPFTAARLLHVASEWVDATDQFITDENDYTGTGVMPILTIVRHLIDQRQVATEWLAQWT